MPMMGPTSDHAEIRQWAAVNGAIPIQIETILFDGEPMKIGFMFLKGAKSEPELKPISWESFFALFDLLHLSFTYDDSRPNLYELLQAEQKTTSGFAVGPS